MHAGRAPLGGAREVALGCLMAARLVAGTLPPDPLPLAVRAARAKAARTWLASLALPAPVRAPLARVADASGRDAPAELAAALGAVIAAARRQLDAASITELESLAGRIGA